MKKLFFLIIMPACIVGHAQELYTLNQIQQIEIFFAQSNWDQLMDAEMSGNENYLLADSVRINGVVFTQVGVKYKGNSSYNPNNAKNPLHINLDYVLDQHYQHYTDLKLGNSFSDPSFLREVLCYDILRNYMDCSLSNYADVTINGQHIGLYSNTESVNKHFLGAHYYSAESPFFKCNPIGGAGPGNNSGMPDLLWINGDSSSYYNRYELESDYGWQELVTLIDTLNNFPAAIENTLDIDRVLWMHAFNNVTVNYDSYSGMRQNYYLYKDLNERWVPTIWDLNESLGGFTNGLSVSGLQTLPLNFGNDAMHPLIQKLLAVPMYQRMYLAHIKTIVEEQFSNGNYLQRCNLLRSTIDNAVATDVNGLYNYNQFLGALTTDVQEGGPGGPGGNPSYVPGIQNLMDARSTFLLGTVELSSQEPIISNVGPVDPSAPISFGQLVSVGAQIANAQMASIGVRYDHSRRFYRQPLYDDGLHNDNAANDGYYAAAIPVSSPHIEYYIYADNNNAGKFSPARAEHEFYTLTVLGMPATAGNIVINEAMTSNNLIEDEYGESDDWVELYNNSDEVVELSSCFLSDDPSDIQRWAFPPNTLIAPHSYLIVWADDDEEQFFRHTNFSLAASGSPLILSNSNGEIIDNINLPALLPNQTYGRYPNGTGEWNYLNSTFNAENSITTNMDNPIPDNNIKIYPNPFSETLNVFAKGTNEYKIHDAQGREITSGKFANQITLTHQLPSSSGIYFLTITGQLYHQRLTLVK
jgi:hypothetical protein